MTDTQSLQPVKVILDNGVEYECTSQKQIIQWKTEGRIPDGAHILFKTGERVMVADIEWLAALKPRQTPPTKVEDVVPISHDSGVMGHMVPAKNSSALTAYYFGVFSLIPLFGAAFGIAAVILGILGIKKSREPEVGVGFWHGVVAVVLGTICTIVWSLLIIGAIHMKITSP